MEYEKGEHPAIRRTAKAEDMKEILVQNRMILELNRKIIDIMEPYREPIVNIDATHIDKMMKDTKPGSQL